MGIVGRLTGTAIAALVLQGCIAKAALDAATAPVKVVAKGVDLATTSQAEADRNRGREIRQREKRLEMLRRKYAKQLARCQDGNHYACDDATVTHGEIQQLSAGEPKPD
jgi:hypothetical protein